MKKLKILISTLLIMLLISMFILVSLYISESMQMVHKRQSTTDSIYTGLIACGVIDSVDSLKNVELLKFINSKDSEFNKRTRGYIFPVSLNTIENIEIERTKKGIITKIKVNYKDSIFNLSNANKEYHAGINGLSDRE